METIRESEDLSAREKNVTQAARVWVKPTLERLSLKQALATPSAGSGDAVTPGS